MSNVRIGSIAIALCVTLSPSSPLWAQSNEQVGHDHDHSAEQSQIESTKRNEKDVHDHDAESESKATHDERTHEQEHDHDHQNEQSKSELIVHDAVADDEDAHDHDAESEPKTGHEESPHESEHNHEGEDHESPSHDESSGESEDSHDGDDHESSGHDEEPSELTLTPKQQEMIDLEIVRLKMQPVADYILVPGEIVSNAYNSSVISPLTDVRILKRYAVLGQHLKKGQPMVTLFSEQLAGLMGELSISAREWSLVRKLGVQLTGKKRYDQARANYRQHVSKVKAFEISDDQIVDLLDSKSKQLLGQYTLYAPHDGVVQKDEFLNGQHFEAGAELFVLVNESQVWVQAQVPPNQHLEINKDVLITVTIAGKKYSGTLSQLAHSINEVTRTRMARIALDNHEHQLHPGQFAQVRLPTKEATQALTLPESSFTRTPDGDWGVFVETAPGSYQLKEVDVVSEFPGFRVIDGLSEGTPVVTRGAFFLASEQAKSGFDIHNH